jgi:hypothetical protein
MAASGVSLAQQRMIARPSSGVADAGSNSKDLAHLTVKSA